MTIDQGWLAQVRRVLSPNCDARPSNTQIDLVVIHGISLPPGEYGGPHIEALFCNCLDPAAHPYFTEISDLKVSSHLLIRRDGEVIQFVPFDKRAWHAGQSCFDGQERCNDFSIGIELEGCDDESYENIQYRRLADLVRVLMQTYPGIKASRIVGHSDIAPGRKSDPGPAFDWEYFRQLLSGG